MTRAASASDNASRSPGRRDLSDAVPEIALGGDSGCAQCADDADLDCKQHRLGNIGARDPDRVETAFDPLGNRPAERRTQDLVHLLDCSTESRIGVQRRPPHARKLRTIAAKNKSEPSSGNSRSSDEFRGRFIGQKPIQ